MDYQNVSAGSQVVNLAIQELAELAKQEIAEQEIKKAKANIKARIEANTGKLAQQGKVLSLQKDLEKAAEALATHNSDIRKSLSPLGRVEARKLSGKVSAIEEQISTIEAELNPAPEEKLPPFVMGVRVIKKSAGE